MARRNRLRKRDNFAFAVFACPAVALLIWYFFSSDDMSRLLLNRYVLIGTPLYVLVGSYPPIGSRWFWKAMVPIAALVSIAAYIQVQVSGWFQYIGVSVPSRMAFGFTAGFAVLEAVAALRIVDATDSQNARD